ncbi:uncharacterized protein ColSpa_02035 [Colletotrichum spaethianum]|uniref:Uncharacterized protein n=1 Tax=Colletotrichum spaethianum TaxID=700344 RepID=A0AA37P736_9PEZI|nr:uncharacterized protein ColSpa_02035 [Colletotrichum spaethianum]GKT41854.1 hypothetical protein ColSpa_02035 [Colletotrichum spaethianum]
MSILDGTWQDEDDVWRLSQWRQRSNRKLQGNALAHNVDDDYAVMSRQLDSCKVRHQRMGLAKAEQVDGERH